MINLTLSKRIFIILLFLLITLISNSQIVKDSCIIRTLPDSTKITNIENELRDYGKQSFLTDKLTLIQFGIVICGAVLSVPAVPLLIITSALNLTNVAINWRADRKLSQFNKHKILKHDNKRRRKR
jgi:hypothetical protein